MQRNKSRKRSGGCQTTWSIGAILYGDAGVPVHTEEPPCALASTYTGCVAGNIVVRLSLALPVCACCLAALLSGAPADPEDPVFRAVDLDLGESREVHFSNGTVASVRLIARDEIRDSVRQAVRSARVRVEVNGHETMLNCGNYRLPLTVGGVQIDCPVTKGYLANARTNPWGLDKDARLRVWPAASPLLRPGTYVYPVQQRWSASDTQMSNEPSFVDGSEEPARKRVYYHYGLDIGGVEGLTHVISATGGLVVVRGNGVLPAYRDSPYIEINYDGVIVLDERGWFHWYFHLARIDPGVTLGSRIRIGQNIGVIGKEGHAGCWSHLHYEIRSLQPSGKPGIQEGYAFLWEAYQKQYSPDLIAVARPHSLAWVGEEVVLDGGSSWSRTGKIERYDWTFTDGGRAEGPRVKRVYAKPGTYSEILKITDAAGRVAYDFAVVQIAGKPENGWTDRLPPTIHAAYSPALDARPGQTLTFAVRTCRTTYGREIWRFGDGSAPVVVKSDGCAEPASPKGYAFTQHAFKKPGDYIVRVERANERGERAVGHLHVRVCAQ